MTNGSQLIDNPEKTAAAEWFELPVAAQYAITLLLVAAATLLAYASNAVVPAPGLTLIFVLPVVIAGTTFGLGASIGASITGVLAFDFFFTQPYYTLRMTDPSEIWAALLLLLTAGIVSTVSWQSWQYAFEARRAAAQAEELRTLAHAAIEGASQTQLVQVAATALNRIFGCPTVVLCRIGGIVRIEATSGGAELTVHDIQAAQGALEARVHMRRETFPHAQSRFDMWPAVTGTEPQFVAGVDFGRAAYEKPADADRLVEIVLGYLVPRSSPSAN